MMNREPEGLDLLKIKMEAREKGHLHIALGAINTAARLAQIIS